MLTPTCVWRASPELIVALDVRFGEPVDAYVNGSQVWLRDDGPGEDDEHEHVNLDRQHLDDHHGRAGRSTTRPSVVPAHAAPR